MRKYFGTDGIRRIANSELTPELVYRVAKAGAYVLSKHTDHTPTIFIGRDTRISGTLIEAAMTAGFLSYGANVKLLGVLPTPGVAYLTRRYKADASVVISASHNTFEFNGIKYFSNKGMKIPDSLEEEIRKYNKAFEKLMKRKEVRTVVKGYIRKLEVTYQKEKYITKELWKRKKDYYEKKGLSIGDLEPNYDTCNPHFHVVIAVNKSYFTDKDYYISRERWLELWQLSTGDKSITQVDVRKAKSNNHKEVYELAKYSAKDSDYLVSRPVFEIFYKALKGKQVLVFSGLFKDAHKMYKLGELDIYKKQSDIEYVYKLYYNWYKNEYENTKCIELTEEEKMKINKKLVDEIEID